jgi:hypothetical protein
VPQHVRSPHNVSCFEGDGRRKGGGNERSNKEMKEIKHKKQKDMGKVIKKE